MAPISGLSPNAFKSVMDIDVLGTFNTVKATMPYLIESAARNPNPSKDGLTGGRIIYVSATFHYTGMPLQAHVAAAKASVDSIMTSVALEVSKLRRSQPRLRYVQVGPILTLELFIQYGPFGITSNVIAPGGIEGTEGMARLASNEVALETSGKAIPVGRWGKIRDIADATVYLFSDAGNYVNGEVLVVDGGEWRASSLSVGLDSTHRYPDFLLKGEFSKNLKSGRKEKSKL